MSKCGCCGCKNFEESDMVMTMGGPKKKLKTSTYYGKMRIYEFEYVPCWDAVIGMAFYGRDSNGNEVPVNDVWEDKIEDAMCASEIIFWQHGWLTEEDIAAIGTNFERVTLSILLERPLQELYMLGIGKENEVI